MTRTGPRSQLALAMAVTESIPDRADSYDNGGTSAQNLPEELFCMLIRRKLKLLSRLPIQLGEFLVFRVWDLEFVQDVFADAFKQCPRESDGTFCVGFPSIERATPDHVN